MDWLGKLPPMARKRAAHIMHRRAYALKCQQLGSMGREEARRIVARETRALERLAVRHGIS